MIIKNILPAILLILSLHGGIAQVEMQVSDWENPEIVEINKLPSHTDCFPFENRTLALRDDRSSSKWFQSLNGTWKFNWVKRPYDHPKDFYDTSFDDKGWDDFPVPANWEING